MVFNPGESPGVNPRGVPVSDSAVKRLHFLAGGIDDVGMFFRKKKAEKLKFVPVVLPDPIDPNAPRKKVLIVDDDAVTVKALSMVLEPRGYDVFSAADGSEAISVIGQKDPDILLVDVSLQPDLGGARLCDGFQVTRWLQRANSRKVPVFIISASDKPAYRQQAKAIGADGFIAKPIDKETLIDSLESALANPAPVMDGMKPLKMAEGSFAS